jgi:hypothetical protein
MSTSDTRSQPQGAIPDVQISPESC